MPSGPTILTSMSRNPPSATSNMRPIFVPDFACEAKMKDFQVCSQSHLIKKAFFCMSIYCDKICFYTGHESQARYHPSYRSLHHSENYSCEADQVNRIIHTVTLLASTSPLSLPASPIARPRHWAASQRTSALPLLNIIKTGFTLALYRSTLTWPPFIGGEADS